MNKYFLLALVHFSLQLEAFAASIPDEYFDSLPNFNIQNDVDFNYDFIRGQFSWLTNSNSVIRLEKEELATKLTNIEFSNSLPIQSANLFGMFFSPSQNTGLIPASEALVNFNNPLNVAISCLNESKNYQSPPVTQPASFWFVIAGLLGFFALLSKKLMNKKSLPESMSLETTNTATVNPINPQEKSTSLAKLTILKFFDTSSKNLHKAPKLHRYS